MTNPACEGAPDLAIEVLSPWDRATGPLGALPGGRKFADYERFGVPHYWVAHPEFHTVAQYALRDHGRYGPPVLLSAGDELRSPLFPRIELPVTRVFATIRRPGSPLHGLGHFAIPDRTRPAPAEEERPGRRPRPCGRGDDRGR